MEVWLRFPSISSLSLSRASHGEVTPNPNLKPFPLGPFCKPGPSSVFTSIVPQASLLFVNEKTLINVGETSYSGEWSTSIEEAQ
ncbi:hypothetical protein DLS42_13165 [Staphylococcus pseudintermedius]|nr:hypothetical protein DLS42_13165 [Staphylococcus pseudintermedius]